MYNFVLVLPSKEIRMRILVTGSSGFIGSHLTTFLKGRGYDAIGYDIREPKEMYGLNRFIKGDIQDEDTFRKALENIDGVIHLAAVHFDYGHTPEEYWDTNKNGAIAMVTAMEETDLKRIVFYSTIAVYGDRYDQCFETTEPIPTSPYGASKLAAEEVFENWCDSQSDRCLVTIRPCAVYGERNITNMNNLIKQIDSGFYLGIGSGDVIKGTAYVGNLVNATEYCYSKLEAGKKIFNYTDSPNLPIKEIINIICDELGKQNRKISVPMWLAVMLALPFEALSRLTGKNFPINIRRVKRMALPTWINTEKIREHGIEQEYSPEQGLRKMVEYYLENKTRR